MTNTFTIADVKELIQLSSYKKSNKKKLSFKDDATLCTVGYEITPVFDAQYGGFVLLRNSEGSYEVLRFESTPMRANGITGKIRPVICDLCFTWQPGTTASRLTFFSAQRKQSIGILCCAKLQCSLHVRKMTETSVVSQAHLRESTSIEGRIERLTKHYTTILLETLR